jgi:hypothetical protein
MLTFCHFWSLSVTFDHFLSLFDQLLGGFTTMFSAHQCVCKASCYDAQHLSITGFIKTAEMGLVTGWNFPTMLSLLKTKLKSDWSHKWRNKWQCACLPISYYLDRGKLQWNLTYRLGIWLLASHLPLKGMTPQPCNPTLRHETWLIAGEPDSASLGTGNFSSNLQFLPGEPN